jgi:4-carboxymuconolactone decarboxylase
MSKLISCLFLLVINLYTMKAQGQEALNEHQQQLAAIAAFTATGNLEALKVPVNKGLDAGLTISEVKEAMVQLYAYCGFPRSLNAINTLMAVLEDRRGRGIKDKEGKEATPVAATDKYALGKKTLQELTGVEEKGPKTGANGFAPVIDTFLKEHLFADIFSRDVLNYRQREFVTIAALAAMPGVVPQLKAHIGMGRNTGITNAQLIALAGIIESTAGTIQAGIFRQLISPTDAPAASIDMLVRISEIEIFPASLQAYKSILKEEAAASVKIEPGVISIFPMYERADSTQIRIVEIYASQEAYRSHLKTPHFQHYKTATQQMVKSLKLVDMDVLDTATMQLIFQKMAFMP